MSEPDFLTRLRAAATRAMNEGLRQLTSDGDGDPTALERVASGLAGQLERWSRNPGLARVLGGVHRDVLAVPGEPVALTANLGVLGPLATHVRVYFDDTLVTEVEVPPTDDLHLVATAPEPGVYAIRFEAHGAQGRLSADLAGRRTLQVVGHEHPVALVDAALVLPPDDEEPDPADIRALLALHHEGFALAYFDVHEDARLPAIFDALPEHGLPAGVILVHAAGKDELRSAGIGGVELARTTLAPRLRGRGVAVTLLVARTGDDAAAPNEDPLTPTVLDPSQLARKIPRGELRPLLDEAKRFAQARARSNPLDWELDQTTGSTLVPGNQFIPELDNRSARRRLFAAIEGAQRSIHVQFYLVRPGRFTDHLIVRLIERARAGVQVRMMVDALYSDEQVLGRRNASIQSLRAEPNAQVVAVAPIATRAHLSFARLKQRDHRKLVIVDGELAFVSGRNASDEYYLSFEEVPIHDNTDPERIPWFDAHVEVRGPLVASIQRSFARTWEQQDGAPIRDDGGATPPPTEGTSAGRLVVHHGLADTHGLAMYEAMLGSAQSHVFIVNDFPFVPAIEQSLLCLRSRGIRVVLLTGNATARRDDGTFFAGQQHRKLFEYMVKARLEPLLVAGVEVYELRSPRSPLVTCTGARVRPYVHAKLVTVDGAVASIGSANLDATASFWENEANVVVQDAAFVDNLEDQLRALLDNALRLRTDSDYWKRERAQRAFVSRLWPTSLYS